MKREYLVEVAARLDLATGVAILEGLTARVLAAALRPASRTELRLRSNIILTDFKPGHCKILATPPSYV